MYPIDSLGRALGAIILLLLLITVILWLAWNLYLWVRYGEQEDE